MRNSSDIALVYNIGLLWDLSLELLDNTLRPVLVVLIVETHRGIGSPYERVRWSSYAHIGPGSGQISPFMIRRRWSTSWARAVMVMVAHNNCRGIVYAAATANKRHRGSWNHGCVFRLPERKA